MHFGSNSPPEWMRSQVVAIDLFRNLRLVEVEIAVHRRRQSASSVLRRHPQFHAFHGAKILSVHLDRCGAASSNDPMPRGRLVAPFLHEMPGLRITSGSGQPRIALRIVSMAGTPSTGSCAPIAMKVRPGPCVRARTAAPFGKRRRLPFRIGHHHRRKAPHAGLVGHVRERARRRPPLRPRVRCGHNRFISLPTARSGLDAT